MGIGEYYRKSLINKPTNITDSAGFEAWSAWNKSNGNKNKAINEINNRIKLLEDSKSFLVPGAYAKQLADLNEAIRRINSGEVNNKNGKLYEVELAPKQDEYLLWDKPLSEQSDKIWDSLKRIQEIDGDSKGTLGDYLALGGRNHILAKLTGADLYHSLADEMGNKAASEYLHSIGIRGIKYLMARAELRVRVHTTM